jgi:hypothetical protein
MSCNICGYSTVTNCKEENCPNRANKTCRKAVLDTTRALVETAVQHGDYIMAGWLSYRGQCLGELSPETEAALCEAWMLGAGHAFAVSGFPDVAYEVRDDIVPHRIKKYPDFVSMVAPLLGES